MPDPAVPAPPSVARRVAAAVALLALLTALAVVLTAVLRDPLRALLLPVLLLACVTAAWTALVNVDGRRIVAALVALVAFVALAALLLAGPLLRTALVVVLVVVAVGAAQLAVARDLVHGPGERRPVGAARHGVLFLNPWSGGGAVARSGLVQRTRELGVDPVLLGDGEDLRALAERAVARGADVIGMAGGDGSQAVVADVARRHDVAFVCVPAGTRNHFALDLGLDRADLAGALEAFGTAVERRVDLATVGDRVFVNNASLGVYATVVRSEDYRATKLATTARLLPDLLGPDAAPFDLRFRSSDGQGARTADLLLVSNGPYRLGHLGGFGTRERMDTGLLGVVTVTVDRAWDVTALLAAEAGGHLERFHGYREWTTPAFRVDSGVAAIDLGIDGESVQLAPPLEFRSLPGALRVRVPVEAPGAPPAAVAPAGLSAAVTALFRVLAGRSARPPAPGG